MHWGFAMRLSGNYLNQTFIGKLTIAFRTHDFHRRERARAVRTNKTDEQSFRLFVGKTCQYFILIEPQPNN